MLHIHQLNGRMRISSSLFKKYPLLSANILHELKRLVGITTVARNSHTGNLLVHYCPRLIEAKRIVVVISRLHRIANVVAFPILSPKEGKLPRARSLETQLLPLVGKVMFMVVAEKLAARIGGPVAVRIVKLLL